MTSAFDRNADGVTLAIQATGGDRRATARLLTLVENGHPEGRAALAWLFPRTGNAHIIGFTGSTGVGKSTLLNRVAVDLRGRGCSLAIVAVDPTSPFSGGALLGDRLRMRDLADDASVFIRSMASRGHPGGLAAATRDVVTVLDALGYEVILVETVGAGQVQVEVSQLAQTVVLVEAPGMGDDVQTLKAGLMEIADVIVVNKADRPEARQTVTALHIVPLSRTYTGPDVDPTPEPWTVPVLEASALEGWGIEPLVDAIAAHRAYLGASDIWQLLHTRRARDEVEAWLRQFLWALAERTLTTDRLAQAAASVARREVDPASAAQDLLDALVASLQSCDPSEDSPDSGTP